jgi:hypothetical protein
MHDTVRERFILADPSFKEYSGHCYEYLRILHDMLQQSNHEVVLLGNRDILPEIAAKTNTLRIFTHWCDARPVRKDMNPSSPAGRQYIRATHEKCIISDLNEADMVLNFRREDVLFLNTLRHWPLRGLVQWLERLGECRAPKVVLVLHFTAFPSARGG